MKSLKFKPMRLADFDTCKIGAHKRGSDSLSLDLYLPWCPYCGSSEVISKGWRRRKRKGDRVRRFLCKSCKRRFIIDPTHGSHFPLWVWDRVLDLLIKGVRPKGILGEIKRESKLRNQSVTLSAQTIFNLVKRSVQILLEFELSVRRGITSLEWQIDDTYEIFPVDNIEDKQQTFFNELKSKKKKWRKFIWVTNLLEVDTRYWLVGYVSSSRRKEVSAKSCKLALKRGKHEPCEIKCDGLQSHIWGIKKSLPHAIVRSKKKGEDFGWINYIESLHSFMRRLIQKRGRFRSLENLQDFVDLVRFHYNFLRLHAALNGETPARMAGISYPRVTSWRDLICFAYSYIRAQRARLLHGSSS